MFSSGSLWLRVREYAAAHMENHRKIRRSLRELGLAGLGAGGWGSAVDLQLDLPVPVMVSSCLSFLICKMKICTRCSLRRLSMMKFLNSVDWHILVWHEALLLHQWFKETHGKEEAQDIHQTEDWVENSALASFATCQHPIELWGEMVFVGKAFVQC